MYRSLWAIALAAAPMSAAANEFGPAMEAFLNDSVMAWADDSILVETVRAQNAATADRDQTAIDSLDLAWRAEVGAGSSPTIDPIIGNAASDFLRQQVEASGGRVTEVILMDHQGMNAAVSHITSDMWQGDEAKFTETYMAGPGSVHFGDIEKDESTGRYQGQISFSLVDPETGELIGAVTVGVDAESLL